MKQALRVNLLVAAVLSIGMVENAMAAITIADKGTAKCAIYTQAGASEPEKYAAEELAHWLKESTGATIPVRALLANVPLPENAIVIGQGTGIQQLAPDVNLTKLGDEETFLRVKGTRLLIGGGRPRGTVYAVYRFLQTRVGIRWWSPWATDVPAHKTLRLADFESREKPAFESRDPFWYPAFDGDWAVRNYSNSASARLTAKHGGKVTYKGFVHTFYPLVPPEKYFATHPEWYSERDGKRTTEGAQLCTTDPNLRDFMVGQVRSWLKESPDASIISISQNDWYGQCTCPKCKALDEAEGSPSASVLSLVNYIAEKLEPEFPKVAFDTLAYQYTRRAPKTITPRENVIVRLCSIECNFREPLEAEANRSFGDDLRAWSKKSKRLYIWDYTTNFAHYTLPHPNWFELGPNVRFFHQHGVRGLFEQGAYQSNGSEMSELRAWVLAQLLWNPYQDDTKLIDEFLTGYYGKASGRFIRQYMDLLHTKSQGWNLTCYSSPAATFLNFATLAEAERLWQAAIKAASTPEQRWRVRQGHNSVRYAFLANWYRLRRECREAKAQWPLPESVAGAAQEWLTLATGTEGAPQGWEPMRLVNEGGLTPQAFVQRFRDLEADSGPLPPDLTVRDPKAALTFQESAITLVNRGTWIDEKTDPKASNGKAAWMPGNHREWAFQLPFTSLPEKLHEGRWKVYAVIRVEKMDATTDGPVATLGIYNTSKRLGIAQTAIPAKDATEDYRTYPIGVFDGDPDLYVWIAPVPETKAKALWIDKLLFIPD